MNLENRTCVKLIKIPLSGKLVLPDFDLVCGLKFLMGCQDRLRVNSDADETLA